MAQHQALQDLWPLNTCYGCGPSNPDGMHLKSYWSEDQKHVYAIHTGNIKYNTGFPGIMFGGTVASLIDCQSIWTAIAFAHKAENSEINSTSAIVYVTKQITVNYIKGTPLEESVYLKSWVEGDIGRKVTVICELGTQNTITATGNTIAVRIG